MSEWKAKRFWSEATVEASESGFSVLLDGRPVKTPAKTHLVVPTDAMAQAIAAEWDAQEEAIDPLTMPVTRGANAALDKVSIQFNEVADMLVEYGDTDLLCYRAEGPEGLVQRQISLWDPMLDWAHEVYGARLLPAQGVIHVAQDQTALARLSEPVRAMTAFELAGFHDLVGISGSLVLGLAVTQGRLPAKEAWSLSRLDEDWQIEQWGSDEEAEAVAEKKKTDFLNAAKFYQLSRS